MMNPLKQITGRFRKILGVLLVATTLSAAASLEAAAQRALSADVNLELQGFASEPLYEDQNKQNASIGADVEWYRDIGRYDRLLLHTFARLDAADAKRTKIDIREAYWQHIGAAWEMKVGLGKVFWGVMESNHLVDIINQTDAVESVDGEDKLGQPMIQATWVSSSFLPGMTLDLFVMPVFRTRTFAGKGGRLRAPFIPEANDAWKSDRLDVGARIFLTAGPMDIGISGFHGTSREPLFALDATSGHVATRYPVISQLAWDIQAVYGAWLIKSEALFRSGFPDDYTAISGGFEYTFSGLLGRSWDLGVLSEYHHDNRDQLSLFGQQFRTSFLERDLFTGARLALNDVQGTELLAGMTTDVVSSEQFIFVEGSRRLSSRFRAELEVRMFNRTKDDGFLYFLRDDSFGRMTLTWFY